MSANKPVIAAIVAAGKDWAIGRDNDMLWHLPNDFRFFKQTTLGHPVIMGRKTFLSLGKPLPGRQNIVVTRQQSFTAEGIMVVHSLEAAIAAATLEDQEMVFVIGGGEIYRQALPMIEQLYLTVVAGSFPQATTFFPAIDWADWTEISRDHHTQDERHAYDYTFIVLKRKSIT